MPGLRIKRSNPCFTHSKGEVQGEARARARARTEYAVVSESDCTLRTVAIQTLEESQRTSELRLAQVMPRSYEGVRVPEGG